jgi:multicomponent K+:H+ antiporter subunit A
MMSMLALGGGAVLYLFLQRHLARGKEGVPLLPSVQGRRIFDSILAAVSWRWARAIERVISTRRLQP